jgi:hypothetical protein
VTATEVAAPGIAWDHFPIGDGGEAMRGGWRYICQDIEVRTDDGAVMSQIQEGLWSPNTRFSILLVLCYTYQ